MINFVDGDDQAAEIDEFADLFDFEDESFGTTSPSTDAFSDDDDGTFFGTTDTIGGHHQPAPPAIDQPAPPPIKRLCVPTIGSLAQARCPSTFPPIVPQLLNTAMPRSGADKPDAIKASTGIPQLAMKPIAPNIPAGVLFFPFVVGKGGQTAAAASPAPSSAAAPPPQRSSEATARRAATQAAHEERKKKNREVRIVVVEMFCSRPVEKIK